MSNVHIPRYVLQDKCLTDKDDILKVHVDASKEHKPTLTSTIIWRLEKLKHSSIHFRRIRDGNEESALRTCYVYCKIGV